MFHKSGVYCTNFYDDPVTRRVGANAKALEILSLTVTTTLLTYLRHEYFSTCSTKTVNTIRAPNENMVQNHLNIALSNVFLTINE